MKIAIVKNYIPIPSANLINAFKKYKDSYRSYKKDKKSNKTLTPPEMPEIIKENYNLNSTSHLFNNYWRHIVPFAAKGML